MWVVDESTLALVREITTVFVKPAFDAREVVKFDRVLFDIAKLKVTPRDKLRVGAVCAEDEGDLSVEVTAEIRVLS